jgi:bifunctional non-homologous end joining protein LigD
MPLPQVQPIIPTSRKEPFDDPDWLFEFKYDGFRAVLYSDTLTRFDALARSVAAELEASNAILDGELVALDETGRPQFYDLLRRTRSPVYAAFDVLWLARRRRLALPAP